MESVLLSRGRAAAAVVCAVWAVVALEGCTETRRPRARAVNPEHVTRDMPSILRGVVGAEATLRGNTPELVTGYGIVVGLNGTGSADVVPSVRTILEREMSRRGVGKETSGMGWTSPSRMIDDPNTAVVLVQAIIAPGAPEGSHFDVLVSALPGSATTSLEGGVLWTTELRPGFQVPGGPDVPADAKAAGEVFINPFTDPAAAKEDGINRRTGRILGGGVVTKGRELALSLDNPSHARARSIVAGLNSRFPQEREDRKPVAIGANEELIEINVPQRYSDDPSRFIDLLLASRVDMMFNEEWARNYTQAMKEQPDLAPQLAQRVEALGGSATPFLRPLYTHPEMAPRLAALTAGARLGDALTAPYLREIATGPDAALRTQAIALLGGIGPDPRVNEALRSLLDAAEIEVRIAAYEALAERGDPRLERRVLERKFTLDIVPSSKPLVYVSQQGQPRIVLFGSEVAIHRPTLITGWSDRLMLAADSPTDSLRIYYLDHQTGESVKTTVNPKLSELIEFMAHEQTPERPEPGLDLSYSEVVGALHEIWKANAFPADFMAEQDKLAAELLRSLESVELEERPERAEGAELNPAKMGIKALDGVLPAAENEDAAAGEAGQDENAAPPPPPPPEEEDEGRQRR